MEDTQLLTENLAHDLSHWLMGLKDREAILEYVKRFPENRRSIVPDLCQQLLTTVRLQRRQTVEELFSGNVLSVLDEQELLEFLRNCTKYNPTSVVARFAKRYPQLRCTVLKVDPQALEDEIEMWRNTLYFLAAWKWIEQVVPLRTIMGYRLEPGQYQAMHETLEHHLGEFGAAYLRLNQAQSSLDSQVEKDIRKLLEDLGFLPREAIENLLRRNGYADLYQFLSALSGSAHVVALGLEAGLPIDNVPVFEQFLWFELKDEIEIRLFAESAAKVHPGEDSAQQYTVILNQALSLARLKDGSFKQKVLNMRSQLSEPERHQFSTLFRLFCERSVVIQAVLDPLEVESVFESIQAVSLPQRASYVRSLEGHYNPEAWPMISELLLLFVDVLQ